MNYSIKRRLVMVSIVYWFLLSYLIAALVWWFIALENQNKQLASLQLSDLNKDDPAYQAKYEQVLKGEESKHAQYIEEGITFLALTIVGAVFVYRAAHRQISLQQQQENFMMAVTHELKTPIAIAKLNLETLQKHHLDESKTQKLLLATLQETNRLDNLASNVLVSAQLEGGKYRIAKEELNFSGLVKTSFNECKGRFPDRRWQLDIEPDLDLEGDTILLTMLVNNLLENAIKYSPKEGLITCSLTKKNNHILLQIMDEGPGIPGKEKKKVFGKFYRIGNEETRTTKGTGLGLYLCKRIAKDHNASVRVVDNSPTGCNFIISFTI